MMKLIPLALAAVLASGCSRSIEASVTGDWVQEVTADNGAQALLNAFVPKTRLTLNKDHTFVVALPSVNIEFNGNAGNMSLQNRVEGRWEVQGEEILFHPETSAGKNIGQLRSEASDARAKSEEAARQAQMAEALRQQDRAAMGYTEPLAPSAPSMPIKTSSDLVLPESAKLSDDHKRLTLRYEKNVAQAVELVRK